MVTKQHEPTPDEIQEFEDWQRQNAPNRSTWEKEAEALERAGDRSAAAFKRIALAFLG